MRVFFNEHFIYYKTHKKTSFSITTGFLLIILMVIQTSTGLVLLCTINHNYITLLKPIHSIFSAFIIFIVYLHMFKSIYYRVWASQSLLPIFSGVFLLFFLLWASFSGYVIPWGQMSFWGITVVSNIFKLIPFFGDNLSYIILGSFVADDNTLVRIIPLHAITGVLIYPAIVFHIIVVHKNKSIGDNNPVFEDIKKYSTLYPNHIIKDFFVTTIIILILGFYIIIFYSDWVNSAINFIESNPNLTPSNILPEWYFFNVFGTLRYVFWNEFIGILGGIASIIFIPFLIIFGRGKELNFYLNKFFFY